MTYTFKNIIAEVIYRYLQLLCKPQQLIEALYSDKRILQRSQAVILHCPDINAAVAEIAELHNIDVQEIRIEIIENLLQVRKSRKSP